MAADYRYVGSELDLFAGATRWKAYFRSHLQPYLGNNVLEVGAGLGGTTRLLCRGDEQRWLCLEPDAGLAQRLKASQAAGELPTSCKVEVGTLAELPADVRFDTVLYIDVLEHIKDDRRELALAADRLSPGGHLIVLSPAHGWLFTPFDTALGHFRRYTRHSLRAITPAGVELQRLFYLDSVGMLASLGNRLLLKQATPTPRQIAFWDKCLAPCSRWVDPCFGYRVGKSIVGIWRKQ